MLSYVMYVMYCKEESAKRFTLKIIEEHREYIVNLPSSIKETEKLCKSGPLWYNWSTNSPNMSHILDYLKACGYITMFTNDRPL